MFSLIFKPLSKIYRLITTARNILYDRKILKTYRSKLPIVCIGNITVGGTGKTPLCIELVNHLKNQGRRPVVLTRGYKGSLQGPILINESHSYREVGDEPLLIYERTGVPVVVSKSRVTGAKFIEQNNLGNFIILDDGFQHRALERDLNILCVNCADEKAVNQFIEGELLPYGIFREAKSEGIKRADILILNSRSTNEVELQVKEKILANINSINIASNNKTLPVYTAKIAFESLDFLQNEEVVAFCAIANPEGFFASLESLSIKIINKIIFPDHYEINLNDIQKIIKFNPSVKLVCTEKDFVKIRNILKENNLEQVVCVVRIKTIISDEHGVPACPDFIDGLPPFAKATGTSRLVAFSVNYLDK